MAAGVIIITQSPLLRWQLLPRLEKALDLQVEARSVYIARDGHLVMDKALFRLTDVEAPADEFLAVSRILIDIDWWRLLRGEAKIRGVEMNEPVLVVSQSLDDRMLNIGRLALPPSETAPGAATSPSKVWASPLEHIPTIVATGARLELGEHQGGRYTPLRLLHIDGHFAPSLKEAGAYEFLLTEREAPDQPPDSENPGLRVSGIWSQGRFALTVENFLLDAWPAESVPSPVRGLFRDLDLRGNVPRTSFTYVETEGITARFDLRGVAMNLPVEATLPAPAPGEAEVYGPPPRFMRLRDTEGAITFTRENVVAQVQGRVEDMPYRVTWFHQGTSQNSAFTCDFVSEGFRIERNPLLLPYAPPTVAERLRDFSSPTATVDTRMTIRRGQPIQREGEPEQPGPITVTGQMDLKDGVAAFENFPYQVIDISGTFRFTSEQIELIGITGRSRTGASVTAHGLIAPLDDEAQVDVTVEVRQALIDEEMIRAFGEEHRDLIPSLFSEERYRSLLEQGLIRTRAQAAEEERERAALRSALAANQNDAAARRRLDELLIRAEIPIFDLGGAADIRVHVHRPYGDHTPWQTTVDITLPEAGLLPEVFPLPIVARNVTVHVDNSDGRLTGGTFTTLSGAAADVAATFAVPLAKKGAKPRVDVAISAADVALDDLVMNALPGKPEAEYKRIMRDLHLSGSASGQVRVAHRPSEGAEESKLGFDADLRVRSASASPGDGDPSQRLLISALDGRVQVNEHRLILDFQCTPAAAGHPAGGRISGQVRADLSRLDSDEPATYTASINWPDLPLEAPIEGLIRVFSAPAADRIVSLRQSYSPTGLIDVSLDVKADADGPVATANLASARRVAFNLLESRAEIIESSGSVSIATEPGHITFDDFESPLVFADAPAGSLSLSGRWSLEAADPDQTPLIAGLRHSAIEGPLMMQALKAFTSDAVQELVAGHNPRGIIDLHAALIPGDDGPKWRMLRVAPHALALEAHGTPVELSRISGIIEVEPARSGTGVGSGVVRGLSATAPEWSLRADAAWTARDNGATSIRSEFAISGQRLTPDLLALLPDDVRETAEQLMLEIAGPFQVDGARLDLTLDPEGQSSSIDFSASTRFREARVDAGVEFNQVTGRAEARYERPYAGARPIFNFDIRADAMSCAGIDMTDGMVTIRSGSAPGEIVVTGGTAEIHGGRIAATARVWPTGNPAQPPADPAAIRSENLEDAPAASPAPPAPDREFHAFIQLSGVRFNPLLNQLIASVDPAGEASPELVPAVDPAEALEGVGDGTIDLVEAGDLSRGILGAQISLTGMVGEPDSRRGRGIINISDGRVLNLPVVMALIEVANLQLPFNSRLDFARADFYIDGGVIVFNELAAYSRLIEIVGHGTLLWPEQTLDLRFNTRSARPIPILSQIVQGIRSQFVTTTVRGSLSRPDVRLQQPTTQGRILGVGPMRPTDRRQDFSAPPRTGSGASGRGGAFGPGIAPTRRHEGEVLIVPAGPAAHEHQTASPTPPRVDD